MNRRYVIGDKIGQGGLGEVYRSYDSRMNREVAIKRISIKESDTELREESTRQLIKEAGALASLQHPHIVTVYDVDSDEEGPYVVMELISGKTLDELIDNAPLTWPDFRELALQTEEALIAAHELSLIHSDIKPSNLMLTWLPSGKFQIKIVDFGLATLPHAQTKEELDEVESVYGSIFFMAPEQFERVPIDFRTDLYAMGCVYYQALTGTYPFNGETVKDVMISHLHHNVVPIQQVREDIPLWACDWIMWHLNRQPTDRPESAREALQLFLQNDKTPNPPLSQGKPPAAPRSRPMPRRVGTVALQATQPPATTPEAPRKSIVPQPLLPPEGSKPSIYNAPTPTEKTAAIAMPQVATPVVVPKTIKPKGSFQFTHRLKLITAASVAGCLLVGGGSFALYKYSKANESAKRHQKILEAVANTGTHEIPMSATEFAGFIDEVIIADTNEKREAVFRALALAKPNDGSNFETTITEFATQSTQILPELREAIFRAVIAKRATPAIVSTLTEFARTTNDANSAAAAMRAMRGAAGDGEFETFLAVVQYHPNAELRTAAVESAEGILSRSKQRPAFAKLIADAVSSTANQQIRESLMRLQTAASQP